MKRYLPLIAGALAASGTLVYLLVAGGARSVASIFVAAAALVLALVVYLMARAGLALLREPVHAEVQLATGRVRKELEREKQGLLKALKELEFDHAMRKISDEDYADIAARYRGRAIQVMKRLDHGEIDYRKLVERDLRELLASSGPSAAAPPTAATARTTPAGSRPRARPQRVAAISPRATTSRPAPA